MPTSALIALSNNITRSTSFEMGIAVQSGSNLRLPDRRETLRNPTKPSVGRSIPTPPPLPPPPLLQSAHHYTGDDNDAYEPDELDEPPSSFLTVAISKSDAPPARPQRSPLLRNVPRLLPPPPEQHPTKEGEEKDEKTKSIRDLQDEIIQSPLFLKLKKINNASNANIAQQVSSSLALANHATSICLWPRPAANAYNHFRHMLLFGRNDPNYVQQYARQSGSVPFHGHSCYLPILTCLIDSVISLSSHASLTA